MTDTATRDRELVLERVFDAPAALVFQAYTDPAHLPFWFGPKGFTITMKSIDVKVGGSWHFLMHGPDGKDWENFHRYVEIVPNQRLVVDVGHSPDGAPHFRSTITFEEKDGKTHLTQHMLFPTAEALEVVKGFGAVELGYQTLDKLGQRLKTMGLSVTREFKAPRELVYKAWSDPQALAKWWGPKGMTIEVLKLDFRPGGVFHYRLANDQAEMYGIFHYLEMESPSRIVWTNGFSNAAGEIVPPPFPGDFPKEVYNVLTLTERDGVTTLNLAGGPHNAGAKEWEFFKNFNASMQAGFKGTFEQLDAYLAEAQG